MTDLIAELIAIFKKLSPEAQEKLLQKAQQLADKENTIKFKQPSLPLGD